MREIVLTKDGSHTIAIPEKGVTYHSVHGAIRESNHVFIEAGLNYLVNQSTYQPVNVFEMGFGTGLNAFLTAIHAFEKKIAIEYTAVETMPLTVAEASQLNYAETLGYAECFQHLHQSPWNEDILLHDSFTLRKVQTDLLNLSTFQRFNLIYYDAFAPAAQPELWTKEVFDKMYAMLTKNGVLVTYCSKGDVRRAMLTAGFVVEKLAGPPGKREMLRAYKQIATTL